MKADHSSPRVTLARSSNLGFLLRNPLMYFAYLGMCAIASRKGMLRWRFRSTSMKPPHSASNLSMYTLVGKGRGGLYLTTGDGVGDAFLATSFSPLEGSSSPSLGLESYLSQSLPWQKLPESPSHFSIESHSPRMILGVCL
ncbi:unnamed protein product [Linum trigynum]|uniref:Uncharacterized protein n=1 Tax=Linum trigynum TaxID=586398 RepID=A0AAV2FU15_9ROSI